MGLFCDLRPVLDSILGPPLLAMGYVQDMRPRSLQDARDDMESRLSTRKSLGIASFMEETACLRGDFIKKQA